MVRSDAENPIVRRRWISTLTPQASEESLIEPFFRHLCPCSCPCRKTPRQQTTDSDNDLIGTVLYCTVYHAHTSSSYAYELYFHRINEQQLPACEWMRQTCDPFQRPFPPRNALTLQISSGSLSRLPVGLGIVPIDSLSPMPVSFMRTPNGPVLSVLCINLGNEGEGPLPSVPRSGSLPHFLVSDTRVMSTVRASKVSRGHANATPDCHIKTLIGDRPC